MNRLTLLGISHLDGIFFCWKKISPWLDCKWYIFPTYKEYITFVNIDYNSKLI